MTKNKYFLIFCVLSIPVIIYFYFLRWKTEIVYGDDLYIFATHQGLNSLSEKMDMLLAVEKYRPVQVLSLHVIMELFDKNLDAYYLYNVGIQSANTLIFATLINLFLKSPFFSLFFSLILGLSRFSLANISLVLLGGREGLCLCFFLLSLFFVVKALVKTDLTIAQKQKAIIWGIVFANLGMYNHERYIMMLFFITLILFLAPALKTLTLKQRAGLSALAIASILLNVILKKYVYSIPFFVGTENTHITFSLSSSLSFLTQAILSIFQINSGPEFLTGIRFSSLNTAEKILPLTVCISLLLILTIYISKVYASFISKQKDNRLHFPVFLILLILCGLFLAPAIATIRLEQRWMQASFSVFILLVVIAFSSLKFKNNYYRNSLFSLFILLFITTNYLYLYKGAHDLYMVRGEKIASKFEKANREGIIHPQTNKIYIWEKERDINAENEIIWSLGSGYIFDFYGSKIKKLGFVDAAYHRTLHPADSAFEAFDPTTEQIFYVNNTLHDITSFFLTDSLKNFDAWQGNQLAKARRISYNQGRLLINKNSQDSFSMRGFYDYENNIRWTNGRASITFMGDYAIKDSLSIQLNTYMPPICNKIVPDILVTGENNKEYAATLSEREGDNFKYKIYVDEAINIQKIDILSDTIDASPDKRILSFPFISLELEQ